MTHFNLRQARLRSGEQLREDVEIALEPFTLGGEEYEVEGRPADWTHGPWPHPTAGIVVELKRAEG